MDLSSGCEPCCCGGWKNDSWLVARTEEGTWVKGKRCDLGVFGFAMGSSVKGATATRHLSVVKGRCGRVREVAVGINFRG
ncbi:hypothetical protein V6N13_060357 [Hibiscus sabdariffa]|uniref:Uncharacterized protein n=1 Tax=Hibiscus sabdariffa TaxID=183260 RepID=A0ABR2GA91_9ROSI